VKMTVIVLMMLSALSVTGCRNIVESYGRCTGEYSEKFSVEYAYSAEKKELKLVHRDAMFNCCVSSISATGKIKNNRIIIIENESLRQRCRCVCPYTVKMKIGGIKPGAYILDFKSFSFPVDLVKNPAGRKEYQR